MISSARGGYIAMSGVGTVMTIAGASMPGGDVRLRQFIRECSGSCGDLGTFIPHVIGAMTVAGLAPFGVLFGFGVSLIGTGLFYGLPLPVQPMKAVSAVILTTGLRPGEVAAAGVIIGVVLLALSITGAIERIARLIPQSISTGLQLGLGLLMAVLGFKLILQAPWIGFAALICLFLLNRVPGFPSAPATLVAAALAGWIHAGMPQPHGLGLRLSGPHLVIPTGIDLWESFKAAVLPQLTLTLTNAVIVTAALARELFPGAAQRVSERSLSLTSGLANLVLCPFGAMPMCHGAGGLQAQYRFGARTGLAPVLFGALLLVLAVAFADSAAPLFALIPIGAVGALLIFAGTDLAMSKRLFDARPSCWPVIAATTIATLAVNPAIGLGAGYLAEIIRARILRRALRPST